MRFSIPYFVISASVNNAIKTTLSNVSIQYFTSFTEDVKYWMLTLYVLYINVSVHNGIYCQRRHALHTEFVHYVSPVGYHRRKPNIKFVGNLLVNESLNYKRHHFLLTVGEFFLAHVFRKRRKVCPMWMPSAVQC